MVILDTLKSKVLLEKTLTMLGTSKDGSSQGNSRNLMLDGLKDRLGRIFKIL